LTVFLIYVTYFYSDPSGRSK